MRDFEVLKITQAEIKANFDDVAADLKQMMTAYESLEVTDENEKERRADLATLRKIKGAIEDKRKSVKKEHEKPYKAFEEECKKLTGIIDKEINHLNTDLTALDVKRIQAKQAEERRIYDENIGEWSEYLPFDAIKNPRWDNKSYKEKDIISDIQEAVIRVKADIQTIKAMGSEFEEELLRTYKVNGNSLTLTMQREAQLRSAKQIAERKAAEDARKAAEASVKAGEQQTPTDTPITQEKPTESLVDSDRWVFTITVNNEEDAKFIRDTCEMFGYEYKEG